ncbi:NAD-dependent epimerase/dehydratase family protein [Litorivicinus sp.]|nr:NAD-dependent epimerase/dehydratase family protein [Litorivicinus sp.]
MLVFDVGHGLISSCLIKSSSHLSSLGWLNSRECIIEDREFKNVKFPTFQPKLNKKVEDGLVIFGIKNISKIDEDFFSKAKQFFETLFRCGFTKILCLSSVAVYGDVQNNFSGEADELNPLTEYGRDKKNIEQFFESMVPQSVLIVRISNLFGLPQSGSGCFLDAYINSIKNKKKFISQFDKDFRRDFISFEFLISSLSTVLKGYNWREKVDILNICSGESISFGRIIEVSNDLGFSPQVEYRLSHDNIVSSRVSANKMIEQYSLQYSTARFWVDFNNGLRK